MKPRLSVNVKFIYHREAQSARGAAGEEARQKHFVALAPPRETNQTSCTSIGAKSLFLKSFHRNYFPLSMGKLGTSRNQKFECRAIGIHAGALRGTMGRGTQATVARGCTLFLYWQRFESCSTLAEVTLNLKCVGNEGAPRVARPNIYHMRWASDPPGQFIQIYFVQSALI